MNASLAPAGTGADALTHAQDRFVEAWGGMAGAWGVGRTMAEAHALLYITAEPLNTDDIMRRLRISRGNASTTLRALVDWGLASRTHKRGDRKEYFVAEQDVWSMLRTIIRERRKRELDPLITSLRDLRAGVHKRPIVGEANVGFARRLDAMLEFVGIFDKLSQRIASPDGGDLRLAAVALGAAMDPAPARPAPETKRARR